MLGHGIRNTIDRYFEYNRNTPYKCRKRVRTCIYGLLASPIMLGSPAPFIGIVGLVFLVSSAYELIETFEDIKICREIPECYAIMDVRDIDREGSK